MKVILFANTDWYLDNFRFSLARELLERGQAVTLLSPGGLYGPRLQEMGFDWMRILHSRRRLNHLPGIGSIIHSHGLTARRSRIASIVSPSSACFAGQTRLWFDI